MVALISQTQTTKIYLTLHWADAKIKSTTRLLNLLSPNREQVWKVAFCSRKFLPGSVVKSRSVHSLKCFVHFLHNIGFNNVLVCLLFCIWKWHNTRASSMWCNLSPNELWMRNWFLVNTSERLASSQSASPRYQHTWAVCSEQRNEHWMNCKRENKSSARDE